MAATLIVTTAKASMTQQLVGKLKHLEPISRSVIQCLTYNTGVTAVNQKYTNCHVVAIYISNSLSLYPSKTTSIGSFSGLCKLRNRD